MRAQNKRDAVFNSALWSDSGLAAAALDEMNMLLERTGPVNFMEVCGTHTMAIAASGLRGMLPEGLRMLSGPGCPVCVTAQGDIDRLLELSARPGVTMVTFGDMLKVKGTDGRSLSSIKASGADIRVVYSPADALSFASAEPGRQFVFAGVGFETTAPLIAAVVARAKKAGIANFSVMPLFKLVPPALRLLLSGGGVKISGFLLPGHVSAIIGEKPYSFVASEFGVPCVIGGFEPLDILSALNMLLKQLSEGRAEIENEYYRAVPAAGNPAAVKLTEEVFAVSPAHWRAIGLLPGSGLTFSPAYAAFDAAARYNLPYREAPEPAGCLCGGILTGQAQPPDCPLFGRVCTPSDAVGPCMVSSEGACAAWFKWGGKVKL